jgi:H+/Cl- antiporter ClcA
VVQDLLARGFQQLSLGHADQVTLAVVGMCACLGAVVRAPVTGILIVFEMTHEFSLVPALMLGAIVSQAISRALTRENFYDALLAQDGKRVGRRRSGGATRGLVPVELFGERRGRHRQG